MKVNVEKLKDSEIKISIELTAEEMKPHRAAATKELQGQVKIDGFRKGSIPQDLLEKHVGKEAFMGQVMDIAIGKTYEQVIRDEKIQPVDYPKVNIITPEPLNYEATVSVLPEVEWTKDLKKLSVKKKALKVEDKEVDEVLENLKGKSTKWNDVKRAAKMEDRVEVNFDGFDEGGAPIDGTSSKNHPVVLGSNSLIPGFEEEVVGMKIDEKKDFDIVFPEDYHSKKFQKKKVKFKIELKRIEESAKPELNDEFAKEITGGHRKTMKELKEEIVEELQKQKERQEELQLETDFLKELPKYAKAHIAQVLIDREIDFMSERMKEDLKKQGKSWEDYEKEMKEKKKDIRKELEKPAKEQVLIRLALEAAYDVQKIEVNDKEIKVEIEEMILRYPPQFAEMARERMKEGGEEWSKVFNQLRLRKLVALHTK
ncbi:MAG: trigger factor [Oceanicoccus sp.]|jgi:trigger factor